MSTILSALYEYYINHQGDIASKILASAGYDFLKKNLDFSSLGKRIKRFFSKPEDEKKFVELLNETKPTRINDPEKEVREIYQQITDGSYQKELTEEIKFWLQENDKIIKQLNSIYLQNHSGINIGIQNTRGNVYNISGDYNINREKDDNSKTE